MSSKTTLLLAPALAPLTGNDPQGCAVRDFARALQQSGWQVTIVIAIDAQVDTNRVGLARRLEPLEVAGASLVVHEGSIESGDIQLLALAGESRPKPALCLEAALGLVEAPALLQLWSATRSAMPATKAVSAEGTTVVVHLSQDGASTEAVRAQLAEADLLFLSSKTAAHEQRRKKNSKWGDLSEKLHGLPPGLDEREWNPARDSMLAQRMTPPDLATKAVAKTALRRELGLSENDVPLIGMVQEIKDLPREVAAELLKLPVQFVGIDAGSQVQSMAAKAPTQVASAQPISDYERKQLRHRIVAAADFILMPGTPTPVSQLFPCRYGSTIIAPKKGEFAERLVNFDKRTLTGSGFLYREDHEIVHAVHQAIATWQQGEDSRKALLERCLSMDASWETVALRFNELIEATTLETISSSPA